MNRVDIILSLSHFKINLKYMHLMAIMSQTRQKSLKRKKQKIVLICKNYDEINNMTKWYKLTLWGSNVIYSVFKFQFVPFIKKFHFIESPPVIEICIQHIAFDVLICEWEFLFIVSTFVKNFIRIESIFTVTKFIKMYVFYSDCNMNFT